MLSWCAGGDAGLREKSWRFIYRRSRPPLFTQLCLRLREDWCFRLHQLFLACFKRQLRGLGTASPRSAGIPSGLHKLPFALVKVEQARKLRLWASWVGDDVLFAPEQAKAFSCRPYSRKFSWSQLLRQMLRGANGFQPAAQKQCELLASKSEHVKRARAALASPARRSRCAAWGRCAFAPGQAFAFHAARTIENFPGLSS